MTHHDLGLRSRGALVVVGFSLKNLIKGGNNKKNYIKLCSMLRYTVKIPNNEVYGFGTKQDERRCRTCSVRPYKKVENVIVTPHSTAVQYYLVWIIVFSILIIFRDLSGVFAPLARNNVIRQIKSKPHSLSRVNLA